MNNKSNTKIYEVIKDNNRFQVKTHNIVYKDKTHIRTNGFLATPRTFEVSQLNKFIKPSSNISNVTNMLAMQNIVTYGFTTNKDLADCYCYKYNLIVEMFEVDNKLEQLFKEENYYAKKKQQLVEHYNKTKEAIEFQDNMTRIRTNMNRYGMR